MNMSATKIRFFALLLGIALTVIVGIAAVSVYAFECRLSLLSAGPGEAAAELSAECGEADRGGVESEEDAGCPPFTNGSDVLQKKRKSCPCGNAKCSVCESYSQAQIAGF